MTSRLKKVEDTLAPIVLSESMSLVEGYLKEFVKRLTKIKEAQNKGPRGEDEEWWNEEERAKAVLERNKEFESFTENFRETM